MPLYEHVFLARPDVSNQQVDTLVETYKTVLTENGGQVSKMEYWGLRPITYRMKKNRKAHYTLMNVDAPPAAVKEMERQMSINEDIVRFMTVRVEQHEDGPSAMMRREPRDERRGPRDRDGGGRDRDRGDRDRGDRDRGERGGGDRDGPRGRPRRDGDEEN